MAENTETDETKQTDLANLVKIPLTEFEKHFHEWMERDDVARGLQAKLRCDLIKNFNKTNLGKQLMAYSMSATGCSTYRLTLTPLVLALNTLVAEFLYAQNCHFTLSVFCTEIPFRNTLPDFECMRNFRFSDREICEIWEAVTNTASTKRTLDPLILDEYETDLNNSLLLLILKSLLNQKPSEMLRKSVEIQTEYHEDFQEKHLRTAAVQVSSPPPAKSHTKTPDHIKQLNKYLLILSQKVNEMTREFELLVKERDLPKSQKTCTKTARSRELNALNRSLERINENVKQLTKTKSKSKRLKTILESIDGLSKQFATCSENFGHVTEELCKMEEKISSEQKPNFGQPGIEKSYSDWVNEMRTTNNGKKFLERVEKSLQKAINKYRVQLEGEAEVKVKHIKSLLKMHYKQKMILRLSQQNSEEHHPESQKLNSEIEMRLRQFEMKQLELVKQLQESSFELQEAQKRIGIQIESQEEEVIPKEIPKEKNKSHKKHTKEAGKKIFEQRPESFEKSKSPRDYDVEKSIQEAKFRLQLLETESRSLEQNFLACLERRKQQHLAQQKSSLQLINESHTKTSEILEKLENNSKLTDSSEKLKLKFRTLNDKLDLDDEFATLKEKLSTTQLDLREHASSYKPMPLLEVENPILEAKNKFFEQENELRICEEEKLESYRVAVDKELEGNTENQEFPYQNQTENKDHEELQQISCELSTYSWSFAFPSTQKNVETNFVTKNDQEDFPKFEVRETKLDFKERLTETEFSSVLTSKSLNNYKAIDSPSDRRDHSREAIRKELFPNEILVKDCKSSARNTELGTTEKQNLKQALHDLKSYTDNMQQKNGKIGESTTTNELLKQSMAKMKQLFEDSENAAKLQNVKFKDCQDKPIEEIKHLDISTATTASSTSSLNTTTTATSSSLAPVNVTPQSHTDVLKTYIAPELSKVDTNILKRNQVIWQTTSTTPLLSKDESTQKTLQSTFNFNSTIPATLLNATTSESDEESEKSIPQREHKSLDNDDDAYTEETDSEDEEEDDDGDEVEKQDDEGMNKDDKSQTEKMINVDVPELVLTPREDSMEIGEVVLNEPQSQIAAISEISTSESSQQTDTDSGDFPKGNAKLKSSKRISDESESDFWA